MTLNLTSLSALEPFTKLFSREIKSETLLNFLRVPSRVVVVTDEPEPPLLRFLPSRNQLTSIIQLTIKPAYYYASGENPLTRSAHIWDLLPGFFATTFETHPRPHTHTPQKSNTPQSPQSDFTLIQLYIFPWGSCSDAGDRFRSFFFSLGGGFRQGRSGRKAGPLFIYRIYPFHSGFASGFCACTVVALAALSGFASSHPIAPGFTHGVRFTFHGGLDLFAGDLEALNI